MSGLPTHCRRRQNLSNQILQFKSHNSGWLRVNSQRAIEFRKWATEILHEYITKGFAVLIAKSALGIEAASFFEVREKDIAESPTFR